MTTLDVSIGGGGQSIDLSSGLFGSAAAVFFRAKEAAGRGEARGKADAGGCDLVMSGAALREVMSGLEDGAGLKGSATREEYELFVSRIQDDVEYRVGALEF